MNRELLEILVCPICKGPLKLDVESEDANGIQSGSLHCSSCQESYPISNGVPVLMSPEKQQEVAERFAPIPRPSLEAATQALSVQRRDRRSAPMVFISHSSKDKSIATELV